MGICHNVHRRRHRWGFCRHDRQAMRKQKYNILKSLATKYTVENQLLPRGVKGSLDTVDPATDPHREKESAAWKGSKVEF